MHEKIISANHGIFSLVYKSYNLNEQEQVLDHITLIIASALIRFDVEFNV